MNVQEYELKIGVFSEEHMDINDLLQFLQEQVNEFLSLETKKISLGTKSNQRFSSTFERIPKSQIQQQQYVGFLFIYDTSEFESIEYVKRILSELGIKGTDQTFIILVEMQTKSKVNLTHEEGRLLKEKYHGDYIKLTIENSEDLVSNINKYLSGMIQNYYFPTEIIAEEVQQQPESIFQAPEQKEYELNYIRRTQNEDDDQRQQYNSPLKSDLQEGFLERTSRLRDQRMKTIEEKQKQIDINIKNLQKVLENMDVHIKSKFETDWYGNLKNSIYSRVQKESERYSKIKLTQQFLSTTQEPNKSIIKIPFQTTVIKRRKNPILKLQLMFNKNSIVLEVFQDSSYQQLAQMGLRKIGLRLTNHNIQQMKIKIKKNIVNFVEQLIRSMKEIQKKKLAQRKYLK